LPEKQKKKMAVLLLFCTVVVGVVGIFELSGKNCSVERSSRALSDPEPSEGLKRTNGKRWTKCLSPSQLDAWVCTEITKVYIKEKIEEGAEAILGAEEQWKEKVEKGAQAFHLTTDKQKEDAKALFQAAKQHLVHEFRKCVAGKKLYQVDKCFWAENRNNVNTWFNAITPKIKTKIRRDMIATRMNRDRVAYIQIDKVLADKMMKQFSVSLQNCFDCAITPPDYGVHAFATVVLWIKKNCGTFGAAANVQG